MACNALAFSVYKSEKNIYRRFFIASSVSAIIFHAGLSTHLFVIKKMWDMNLKENGQIISKEFDEQAALEAGIAIRPIK
jgi:hypothetical protein